MNTDPNETEQTESEGAKDGIETPTQELSGDKDE